jgi:hypothetical protein
LREDDPDLPGKVEDLKAYMKQRLVEMADLNFNYEKPEVFMKGRKAYPIKVGAKLECDPI